MPDDLDYAWLASLIARSGEWSDEDLATARALVEWQERAIADEHPLDKRGQQMKQELVEQLEAAIATYREQPPRLDSNQ